MTRATIKETVPARQRNDVLAFLTWVLGGVGVQVEKAGGGVVGCGRHEVIHRPELQDGICGLGNEGKVRSECVQGEGGDDRIWKLELDAIQVEIQKNPSP